MNKILLSISIVLFLAVGCNQSQPNSITNPSTQDAIVKTSNWLIYGDIKMGYQIKYPTELVARRVGGAYTGTANKVLKDDVVFSLSSDWAKQDAISESDTKRCGNDFCTATPFTPMGLYLNVFNNSSVGGGYDEAASLYAAHKDIIKGYLSECTANSGIVPQDKAPASIYIKQIEPSKFVMVCATQGYESQAQAMLSTFNFTNGL